MNKMIKNAGENYEYLRVIANNHLKLKKIEAFEAAAEYAGSFIYIVILSVLATIALAVSSVITVIMLMSVIHSLIWSLVAFLGIIILLSVIIVLLKSQLIHTPVKNLFYSLYKSDLK